MKMKQNIYPIITIIIGLILSVTYFLYINSCVEDKTWDTATNYLTTILSIVIGAMISIIIYNYQKNLESQQKLSELRINLEAELSDMNRVLNSGEAMTVNGLSFLTTFIEPIIINECAKSGLFSSLHVENLLHISRKIKFYNVLVNYFLSILTNSNTPLFNTLLTNCNTGMESSRLAIINDIKQIQDQLVLKQSESINLK